MKRKACGFFLAGMTLCLLLLLPTAATAESAATESDGSGDGISITQAEYADASHLLQGGSYTLEETATEESQTVYIMVALGGEPLLHTYDIKTLRNASRVESGLNGKDDALLFRTDAERALYALEAKRDIAKAKLSAAIANAGGSKSGQNPQLNVVAEYNLLFNGFAVEGPPEWVDLFNQVEGVTAYIAPSWEVNEDDFGASLSSVGSAGTSEEGAGAESLADFSANGGITVDELSYTGEGSLIAIIDTGIYYTTDGGLSRSFFHRPRPFYRSHPKRRGFGKQDRHLDQRSEPQRGESHGEHFRFGGGGLPLPVRKDPLCF